MSRRHLWSTPCAFFRTRGTAGATGARPSLRPCFDQGESREHSSGENRRENAKMCPRMKKQVPRRCAGSRAEISTRKDVAPGRRVRLLHRRTDRVELVVEELAARVVHGGHDRQRNAGGDQAVLDGGGASLIGKERPKQTHCQPSSSCPMYGRVVFEFVNRSNRFLCASKELNPGDVRPRLIRRHSLSSGSIDPSKWIQIGRTLAGSGGASNMMRSACQGVTVGPRAPWRRRFSAAVRRATKSFTVPGCARAARPAACSFPGASLTML